VPRTADANRGVDHVTTISRIYRFVRLAVHGNIALALAGGQSRTAGNFNRIIVPPLDAVAMVTLPR